MLLEWLYAIIKVDALYHTGRRFIKVAKITGHLGASMFEYGKSQVRILYPIESEPLYVEEIIKLNENDKYQSKTLLVQSDQWENIERKY